METMQCVRVRNQEAAMLGDRGEAHKVAPRNSDIARSVNFNGDEHDADDVDAAADDDDDGEENDDKSDNERRSTTIDDNDKCKEDAEDGEGDVVDVDGDGDDNDDNAGDGDNAFCFQRHARPARTTTTMATTHCRGNSTLSGSYSSSTVFGKFVVHL
jgi:hypothetical protein